MTEATARLADGAAFGRRLVFRVAVHFGAAADGIDPVEEAASFFGPQLSFEPDRAGRASRQRLRDGGVCRPTEPRGRPHLVCTYVGTTSLAKDYGRVRLLALSSRR